MSLLSGKIPGEETGIQVRHTTCDICSPQHHCGVCAYVKDGKLIKTEGWKEHPYSRGQLCTKGAAYKDYLYRSDRILTPLRRVGPRGEGNFEPVSWEEAYREICGQLNRIKKEYGPEQVMFMNGYGKWCKTFLTRLAFSFGSPNLVADGCTCQTATHLAWDIQAGTLADTDLAHASTFLGWAFNPYYSNSPLVPQILMRRAQGMKVIIIDSRITPAAKNMADLFIQIRQGTDGALALGMAHLILREGWQDQDYIDRYVYGFEEYACYVKKFDPETVFRITGVSPDLLYEATRLYATGGPACIRETACTLTQNINGFQTYRAVTALHALTGNYDREGGNLPIFYTYNHRYAGYTTREHEFMMSVRPAAPNMGSDRFPLWQLYNETMGNELADYIEGKKQYPIRAVFGMGMNYRMFPQPDKIRKAMTEKLEFIAVTDLFLTDTARLADIVLPACTSYEREEFRCYPGGLAYYSKPAVDRVGDSRSDLEILSDLAKLLDHEDPLLRLGYRAWINYIIADTGYTVDELQKHDFPVQVKNYRPYVPGTCIQNGLNTATGKFELHSTWLEPYAEKFGYDCIPTYSPPYRESERERYPFLLTSGVRVANSLNSRLHDVPSLRSLRPDPIAELNDRQARKLGIKEGDLIRIFNDFGQVFMKARPTGCVAEGCVHALHGYREADINTLMSDERLDPYTGFPAYRTTPCMIEKAGDEKT